MSDLKHLSPLMLQKAKGDCEKYISNLKNKISGQKTRLTWINKYIGGEVETLPDGKMSEEYWENNHMDFLGEITPHVQVWTGEHADLYHYVDGKKFIKPNAKAFGEEMAKRWNAHDTLHRAMNSMSKEVVCARRMVIILSVIIIANAVVEYLL